MSNYYIYDSQTETIVPFTYRVNDTDLLYHVSQTRVVKDTSAPFIAKRQDGQIDWVIKFYKPLLIMRLLMLVKFFHELGQRNGSALNLTTTLPTFRLGLEITEDGQTKNLLLIQEFLQHRIPTTHPLYSLVSPYIQNNTLSGFALVKASSATINEIGQYINKVAYHQFVTAGLLLGHGDLVPRNTLYQFDERTETLIPKMIDFDLMFYYEISPKGAPMTVSRDILGPISNQPFKSAVSSKWRHFPIEDIRKIKRGVLDNYFKQVMNTIARILNFSYYNLEGPALEMRNLIEKRDTIGLSLSNIPVFMVRQFNEKIAGINRQINNLEQRTPGLLEKVSNLKQQVDNFYRFDEKQIYCQGCKNMFLNIKTRILQLQKYLLAEPDITPPRLVDQFQADLLKLEI